MKPIYPSRRMVVAILNGRKTSMRVEIKHYGQSPLTCGKDRFHKLHNGLNNDKKNLWAGFYCDNDVHCSENGEQNIEAIYYKSPYKPGEILYIVEPMSRISLEEEFNEESSDDRRTLFEMSRKESARIYLRIKRVSVERLQDITVEQARAEGVADPYDYQLPSWYDERHDLLNCYERAAFAGFWDSELKYKERSTFGWNANPWVWVFEFERISKVEACK